MFALNRFETKQVMAGRASGAARRYEECPHQVGNEMVLTSKYLDDSGRSIPFARAIITSIRPGTAGQFRRDAVIAEKDGYKNGEHWFGNLRQMYSGLRDNDKMFHLSFNIVEIDKQAGTRGDLEEGPTPGATKKIDIDEDID